MQKSPAEPSPEPTLPLYMDLSREVRDRLPRLVMSMHFFAGESRRRLVRINGRLLHEGDWVADDLQLLEVTPSGAVLDYLGLRFELRGPSNGP